MVTERVVQLPASSVTVQERVRPFTSALMVVVSQPSIEATVLSSETSQVTVTAGLANQRPKTSRNSPGMVVGGVVVAEVDRGGSVMSK